MSKSNGRLELESLITIQTEMLSENKRIRVLTIWLIALTLLTFGTTILTTVSGA